MSKEKEGKWLCALSEDTEFWRASWYFDTKEQAVKAGKKAAKLYNSDPEDGYIEDVLGIYPDCGDGKILKIAVGQIYTPLPYVNPDILLETVYEDIAGEMGEFADGYLEDVKQEHKDELEELINGWFIKHNYIPGGFIVQNVEEFIVEGVTK